MRNHILLPALILSGAPAPALAQTPAPAEAPAPEPAPAPPAVPAPDAAAAAAPIAPLAPALAPAASATLAPATAALGEAPLAGFSDGTAFLRSSDNAFVMFPNGRLQTDVFFYKSANPGIPKDTAVLRRARLELGGWIGPAVFYSIAGDFAAGSPAGADPVAQSFLNATDDYVALAPWGDLAILQVGQYDAPFTFENRTSDKYFDFMERSIAVRAFGIPSNKEVGAMLHGTDPDRRFYYSAGVFNGDGQNFKNVDASWDVMGRAWVAPLAFAGIEDAKAITIGGSIWHGNRTNALPMSTLTTQGGFKFVGNNWTGAPGSAAAALPMELHQDGFVDAFALELNAPLMHKMGLRIEYINKRQRLAEDDVSKASSGSLVPLAHARLGGWAAYGELWYWALGDDRLLPEPGLQLPSRFKKFGSKPPLHGLMLALRAEMLDEQFVDDVALGNPNVIDGKLSPGATPPDNAGHSKVSSVALGINYWYSKRFRATANYVVNKFSGDSAAIRKLTAVDMYEHEVLFRLGIAL